MTNASAYPAASNDTCLIFAVGDISVGTKMLPTLSPNARIEFRAAPLQNMLEPTTKAFFKQAIETCDAGHEECKRNRETSFLPTRLIDVRDENKVRLVAGSVISSSTCDTPRYAALSYCWGPGYHAQYQLKTTRDNIDAHFTEIPIDQSPPLLRDAIYATRELGVSFLWVDSLCIIQGDREDWVREAGTMHKVYGGAYITICPTLSKSCMRGFLRREAPSITLPYLSASGEPVGTYNIRYQRSWLWKMYYSVASDPFTQDLIAGSWVRRGWTFQEAALSSRMVLFGATAAHFQCRKSRVTEGEGYETPVEIGELALFPLLPSTLTKQNMGSAWRHIISAFSGRSFTQPTDAILALAGLAHHFHSFQTGADDELVYCSGMWLHHLHEQLLWRCTVYDGCPWPLWRCVLDPQTPERVQTFAPSWSWVGHKSVDYQYLDDYNNGNRSSSRTPMTDETIKITSRLPSLFSSLSENSDDSDEDDEPDRFVSWHGQTLEITALTATFPMTRVDIPPLPNHDSNEANTNLFWTWNIANEYLCNANWDFLNLDLWKEVDRSDLARLRMVLLSSGSGSSDSSSSDSSDQSGDESGDESDESDSSKKSNENENENENKETEHDDRAAFGLFLFPTAGKGNGGTTFYRVGTWYSLPKGKGGLANFKRHASVETLVVV